MNHGIYLKVHKVSVLTSNHGSNTNIKKCGTRTMRTIGSCAMTLGRTSLTSIRLRKKLKFNKRKMIYRINHFKKEGKLCHQIREIA